MARKKVNGKCRICDREGPLSFEHVPPAAAFNNAPAVGYKMDEYLRTQGDFASMRGEKNQRGVGAFTLCLRCNNTTGKWYGAEYVEWAKLGFEILDRVPQGEPPFEVNVRDRYPLRFIKQIVTMIFSVNSLGFNTGHPELVEFVLNRDRKHLPPEYQVYLTIVGGPYARSAGVTGLQDGLGSGHATTQVVTEVGYPPLAGLLLIGERRRDDLGCITHFADCGYDDKREVRARLRSGQLATPYPDDYRTRDRVQSDIEASKAAMGEGRPGKK